VNPSYQKIPESAALFADADATMGALKRRLLDAETLAMSHSEVERLVENEGREILRRLFQAHIHVRGQAVPIGPVIGSDGVERTHRRSETTRPLLTVLGPVDVKRTSFGARGTSSLMPVDADLNLPVETYSLEVRRRVAELASRVSFDATVGDMAAHTGAPVPKRQAEQEVTRAACDFDAFYAGTQDVAEPAATSSLLVLSFDGKGVVVRKEDLRPATRAAAAQAVRKLHSRLAKGEKPHRKRMATVAAVYTIAPHVRTPEEIVAGLRHVRLAKPEQPRPRPERKRVWASLDKEMTEVIADAFVEAGKRDPGGTKRWVVLIDGDPKQIRRIRAAARQAGRKVTLVLDFVHVLEKLWKAGYCVNHEGTPQAEEWVLERLCRVLNGQSSAVAGGMRRSATRRGLVGAARKAIDDCARYLIANRSMVRYHDFLREGLPIATGVIEGACRHLICDRMDITGARWSLAGAEAVLRLRALRSSGDFDAYWAFHERQEHRRTHACRYAEGTPPDVGLPSRRGPLWRVK